MVCLTRRKQVQYHSQSSSFSASDNHWYLSYHSIHGIGAWQDTIPHTHTTYIYLASVRSVFFVCNFGQSLVFELPFHAWYRCRTRRSRYHTSLGTGLPTESGTETSLVPRVVQYHIHTRAVTIYQYVAVLQYQIVQYNSIHLLWHINILCRAIYCSVLRVLCEPELDHWNVNFDKLLFLYENLRQLTFL